MTQDVEYLDRDGTTIAVRRRAGRTPGVLFCPGFRSNMEGSKACDLDVWAEATGVAFTRFDYAGHGRSGGDFLDGTIGRWADDAEAVLDTMTSGPQIVVGSSMGGWIALLLALRRPERVAGLVGIAAAPGFTEDLLWDRFDPETRTRLERDGMVEVTEAGCDPEPITSALIKDGRNHLLLRRPLPLSIPVRLLQGASDATVPPSTAMRLMETLSGTDVRVVMVKAGDHRLSRPTDLALLRATVGEVVDLVTD